MCGINGIVQKNTTKILVSQKLERMNGAILHRGPDDEGLFMAQVGDVTLGFAMRRLSIIDLASGKQPITTQDGSNVIVFNGEIYNYQKLRADLELKGFFFQTNSDTEVILKLYECHGTAAFPLLEGMFAFSIFDKRLNKIFIARDFFGEKPMYYRHCATGLMWSSELKSLIGVLDSKPEIDRKGLALFFQLTYIPAPFTIYKDIYKLVSNNYIDYDIPNNTFTLHQILPTPKIEKKEISFSKAKQEIHHLVQESVLSRRVSDVPIGTFLSGGVDSAIVSLCLSQGVYEKINTFSIGFDKKSFDETEKAQTVAKLIGSNHHEFIISEKDLSQDLDHILLNFDEPFADSSALPSFILAQKTGQHLKVALTGDGGDEVFGGYNKYLIGNINRRYTGFVPPFLHRNILQITDLFTKQKEDHRGLKFKIRKSLHSIDYGNDFFYNIIKLGFSDSDMEQYFLPDSAATNPLQYYKNIIPQALTLTDFREVDRLISLEGDMMVKVDRTSMLASLECRAPFLNKKLWDYTTSLPENYLIKGSDKKYILKKAFEQYFPEKFLEKPKQGFGVPVGDWLKQGIRKELECYINLDFLQKQGIFNAEKIRTIVNSHLSSIEDHSFKVWTYYCFQKWYLHNML